MNLNLQKDRANVRKYIEKRIRDYLDYENDGPGNDDDPITLITLSSDLEQDSCLTLVFDTRPGAECFDYKWQMHFSDLNLCVFPKWQQAWKTLYNDEFVTVTKSDGTKAKLGYDDADELLHVLIGEMLKDVIVELRFAGALAKLPLASEAYMHIDNGLYFWPEFEDRKTVGSVLNPAAPESFPQDSESTMNETQIKRLEKKYSITFPPGYRQMLLEPPEYLTALLKHDEKTNPGQTPFFLDCGLIDDLNQMMRDPDNPHYFGFDPNDESKPWPVRYFIIGSDVGGNFYCIAPDSGKSRVYFWYQGDTAFSKFTDDMAGFVKRIFRCYGEIDAMDCQSDI